MNNFNILRSKIQQIILLDFVYIIPNFAFILYLLIDLGITDTPHWIRYLKATCATTFNVSLLNKLFFPCAKGAQA